MEMKIPMVRKFWELRVLNKLLTCAALFERLFKDRFKLFYPALHKPTTSGNIFYIFGSLGVYESMII